ncbi:hypothetical protein AWV79_04240 [Cupriavidus sp. UYMMa02A]|nr:hypothetical protein AWV79_04240 [Cupriavidus sp. UYMMa02A]
MAITLEAEHAVAVLEEAIVKYGQPGIVTPIRAASSTSDVFPYPQRACTLHEETSRITVPALGDAQQTWLAAGCMLLRHESDLGREIAGTPESGRVADSGDDCS